LADSGWIGVMGVAVGRWPRCQERTTSTYVQRRSDTANRKRQEVTERHAEFKQIYTRYQLAADRLENAIRELSEARRLAISEHSISAQGTQNQKKRLSPRSGSTMKPVKFLSSWRRSRPGR
jgi:hypothetical protein